MNLKISDELSLPIDAVTKTFGIVGKKRSGKTSTAMVMCEEFLKRKIPPVIVDPLDACWGLKAGKDGDPGGGYPIYVFGGDHADVPLEPTSGKLIADLIVDERPPMILSLRHFESDAAQGRFVTDLAKQLLKRNREPVPIVFDEADKFAPQNPYPGEREMLGAVDRLVRHGGKDGIGITLITQRPALINKNVLNQVDTLIFMQLVGSTDVDAIEGWIKRRGTKEEREVILSSLASLQPGEGWFWSPGWLEILKKVRFRKRETFDSARTPKVGEKVAMPKELARVDVASLGEKISETVERAKANDPKELRAQLAAAKKTIAQLEARPAAPAEVKTIEREVEVIDPVWLSTVRRFGQDLIKRANSIGDDVAGMEQWLNHIESGLKNARKVGKHAVAASTPSTGPANKSSGPDRAVVIEEGPGAPAGRSTYNWRAGAPTTKAVPRRGNPSTEGSPPSGKSARAESDDAALTKPERTILAAIAPYEEGADRVQISVLTGYARSTRDRQIQYLQAKGFAEARDGRVYATPAGKDALGSDFEELPTGRALADHWLARLPLPQSRILGVLLDAGGEYVSRDRISENTSYARSTRDRQIQYLQARKLVESTKDGVRASALLFD